MTVAVVVVAVFAAVESCTAFAVEIEAEIQNVQIPC